MGVPSGMPGSTSENASLEENPGKGKPLPACNRTDLM
jgi:hypothetical protein